MQASLYHGIHLGHVVGHGVEFGIVHGVIANGEGASANKGAASERADWFKL